MPLSPEQEWTLVACGLVAHADGILEVGEWDQVIWMLDDRIPAQQSAPWLDLLADQAALRGKLDGLSLPPPFFAETILEKAWRMALADGSGSEAEAAVHDELAAKLGADASEVQGWRAQWTEKAAARAELVAGFAAYVAVADDAVSLDERSSFEELVGKLPMPEEAREAAKAKLDSPPTAEVLMGGFAGLPSEDRPLAMLALVPVVLAETRNDRAREAFLDLAEQIAVSREDAERMLQR